MKTALGGAAAAALVAVAGLAGPLITRAAGGDAATAGASTYVVHGDPRLCPSPRCGGYWVALANRSRTRCEDGLYRPRCYTATALDARGHVLEAAIPSGSLVGGHLESRVFASADRLGVLVVSTLAAPAGEAVETGSYVRLRDTGVRCIRAPCFSYFGTRVNGTARTTLSQLDLDAADLSPRELAQASAALPSRDGLLVRGRISPTPDGGRVFRASRVFLSVPLPRA